MTTREMLLLRWWWWAWHAGTRQYDNEVNMEMLLLHWWWWAWQAGRKQATAVPWYRGGMIWKKPLDDRQQEIEQQQHTNDHEGDLKITNQNVC